MTWLSWQLILAAASLPQSFGLPAIIADAH
jgi:hypothetical protein